MTNKSRGARPHGSMPIWAVESMGQLFVQWYRKHEQTTNWPNQFYQPVIKFQNIEESDLWAVQLEQNDIKDKDSIDA